VSETRLSYRFGPLERRGLLGQVTVSQAVIILVSVVGSVVLLDHLPNAGGVIGATTLVGLAAAGVALPVAGRTADQWAMLAGSYLLQTAFGSHRHRSALPTAGDRPRTSRAAGDELHLPTALSGVGLEEVTGGDRTIGAFSELAGRRLTAVLACRAVAFALLDAEAQERRLAQWGIILSSAADTPIRRLQWIERTGPSQGDELARWLHDGRDPSIPQRAPMLESYLELISSSTSVTQDHEVLLVIQVDANNLRGRRRDSLGAALVEQAERVTRGLEMAEVRVLGALRPRQLARVLRTGFDPYARAELAALEAFDGGRDGIDPHGAGPVGAQSSWDSYRCDRAWHATYWIAGWPRTDVSPMFMEAILGSSTIVRTVAVTFEPISPDQSARQVEAAITRDRADSELRRRFGQSETARQRQAQEAALRREAELAAGHAEVRMSGFVTVSGQDEQDLQLACAEVLQHAARARLELRPMYGQQAEAFCFTLPLARGLR
jgi:hypothetical protein